MGCARPVIAVDATNCPGSPCDKKCWDCKAPCDCDEDKPINERVKESIKCHSQFCGSPWYGAKLEGAEGEKKPDAKAQSENDAEPSEGEAKAEEKPKDCGLGEQL